VARRIGGKGTEKVYYITFKENGKKIEEKVGREHKDDMTPSRASGIRAERIEGKRESPKQKRLREKAEKEAAKGRWTVDRLANAYFENRREGKAKAVDRGRYDNYIKPLYGNKEPSEIIKLDVDRLRIKLLKTKKPQTVKHVLNILIWIINYGYKSGLTPPLSFKVQKPTVNNIITEDLSPDELQRLIKAIDEEPDIQIANFMRMALYTGMRRGELFKLKWQDIDFERGFISIRDPKGGPSQTIPLNEAARTILNTHPRMKRSPYVFPGQGGKKRVSVAQASRRIRKAARLPDSFRPIQGLRHAFASMMASSGKVDMYFLQKLLTHKSPQMTQRYAHLRDEALKQAGEVAVELINSALDKNNNDLDELNTPENDSGRKVVK
jgi:integrase